MLGIALVSCAVPLRHASAQETAQPTPEQRQQAADAFDQGTNAMLASNYVAAAHWFEQANRLAPNFAALMQAVRANDRAGNELRAANLALRLRDQYPSEERAQAIAREVLGRVSGRYATIRVECDAPCTIDVGGALAVHNVFFVTPGREITVNATFPGGTRSETLTGEAGAERTVTFVAPPPPPDEPEDTGAQPIVVESGGGAPPALFWASVGATLASGGLLLWSGIDTMNGADRYEAAIDAGDDTRARELLDAGEKKETRTNVLIALTAGLSAEVILLGIFTDFSGDDEDESAPDDALVQDVVPLVGLSPQGGMLSIQGRF
jgi:hypothetical protein